MEMVVTGAKLYATALITPAVDVVLGRGETRDLYSGGSHGGINRTHKVTRRSV